MIEVLVPRENVNDTSVVILSVNYPTGSRVKKGDVILSFETSKTNIEIDAPEDGVVIHQLENGMELSVGSLLFSISSFNDFNSHGNLKLDSESSKSIALFEGSKAKFSIAAVERAKLLGVDLSRFEGGWFTSSDIQESALASSAKAVVRDKVSIPEQQSKTNSPNLVVSSHKVIFSKRKQAEAKNLSVGDHAGTTSTIGIEIKPIGERLQPPPFLFENSISDLIVFEASRLLREYPELNAAYLNERTWAQYESVNFGWSFDGGKNLKVLAIKKSDHLSLHDLQEEVTRLLELYESGEAIPLDLLTEATITFSDLSRSSASFMLPLINGHQTLILGVVRKTKSKFEVFATFDHRVSEGLSVANFLADLRVRILSHFFDQNGISNAYCYACGKSMSEELAAGHRGLIKMTLGNGEEEMFCRNCFEGW